MPRHYNEFTTSTCIATGSSHQGDNRRYRGNNAQCVAMSACASSYSVIKNRANFSTADIDIILTNGDSLYLQYKPQDHIFLFPEQLPTDFRVGNYLVQINSMEDNWIVNGLFPASLNDVDVATLQLANILRNEVFSTNHCDSNDNYLFTGNNYTVSFWKFNSKFYLFNSHAVDESNKLNHKNEHLNRARLFSCDDVKDLAKLLFTGHAYGTGLQYSIHRLTVVNYVENIIDSNLNTQNTPFDKKITLKPIVILNKINLDSINIKPTKPTKRGRPSKQNRKKPNSSAALVKKSRKSINEKPSIPADVKLQLKPVVVLHKIDDVKPKNKTPSHVNNSINNMIKNDIKLQTKPVVVIEKQNIIKSGCNISLQKTLKHREAVKRYTKSNPTINREAVKRYSKNNPIINRDAVKRYTQNNPIVHRDAVKRYSKNNPTVNRDAVKRYSQKHSQNNKESSKLYNTVNRNIDPILRNSNNLIGQKQNDELNLIQMFTLKKCSLNDSYRCPNCNARIFFEEKSRLKWCCGTGAYNVQNLPSLTEDFYTHPSFIQRPRAYNNLFSFSALGVSHGFQNPNTGISFLKIQGRTYHRVFDLAYTDTTNPIGLYIYDERERLAVGQNLDMQVIRSITHFMHSVNPYIECFKRLSQEPSEEAHLIFEPTSRRSHGNILGDMPIGSEIAAILSTDRERFIPKAIVIWRIGARKPHTVDILHPLYETFQYPLLYPHGNPGWLPNKLDNNGIKLTQNKYVRCLLLSQPRFSELGRLSEEWIVDMFSRISEERLRYINNMQNHSSENSIRSAPLQEVENAIEISHQITSDETIQGEGGVVPGRVYLPNTFTGGPRYMKTKYMDAIALVNRLGTPSYFLTMTCNPKWPEIQQSIQQGHRPNPLICARVFNLKLAQLLKDLRTGAWFGKCMYILHVIEFQKRGLPHAHICFRVEGGGPVQNIEIDQFVRADIPPPSEANGRLRKAVLDHMIHGPCGPPHRTDLPCWDTDKGKCTKYFPKPETPTTYCDGRGFTHLRRDGSNQATIKYRNRDVTISDLWVVPYNAALLLKYDCHINVLVYSARAIVKYLFKYMTKGPDESRITIVADKDKYNEIEQYVTKRYLGSCEATWRILEFDVTAREPNVKQLAVHLQGQQSIFFKPGTETDAAHRANSDLITYFNRPLGDEFDQLTYLDFYERYIVHSRRPTTKNVEIFELNNNKFITRRQRGELVSRLFWCAPNRGELSYLRLLLASQPCRSYEDLYKLGGPSCKTFQEAAKAIGIADDEAEYEIAMQEASTFLTGPRLRSFFVLLAVNGVRVVSLWENFKDLISQDILQRLPEDAEKAYKLSLIQIDRLLRRHGTSLGEQGLPVVEDNSTEVGRERIEYNRAELNTYVCSWLPKLSNDQKNIFDYINKLLTDNEFRNSNSTAIFIDGPAGTGKTLLLNVIAAHARGNSGIVLCTASSGIAAQNYVGGITAHSMFKFPLELVDDLGYWNITNGSQRAELIRNADIIIYDEAPMAHKYLIHLLNRSLRDLMKSEKLFGGKIIIFAGDFRQIPPVVIKAKTSSDIINCSVKSSPIWHQIKIFNLNTSQRNKEDPEFSNFLLNLGSNILPTQIVKVNRTTLNLVDLTPHISYVTDLEELIDFVFSFVIMVEPDTCAGRAILTTHNENVRQINSIILDRLEGEPLHFLSIDQVVTENADEIFLGADALNKLQPKGVPDHDLTLKVGCVCMIIRNLSFSDRLVNGTKVIVVRTTPRLITVRKPGETNEYFIPRILFKAPIEPNSPIEMTRRQFPLQVCYAMTVHKSQGQTINRVGVDLRSDVFSHGQLYVALGRVQVKTDIMILVPRERLIDGKLLVHNLVYPQLI